MTGRPGARVLLFTGKGGVGKTTTASATALALAAAGRRTLLLSTDTAHSLGDALGVPLAPSPRAVAPGLDAVQVDTQGRFERAWRDVQRYLLDLLARGGVDPVTAEELTVLPGIDEVLALLAVREYAEQGRWDALVVDCAPTAETLRLLALPDALGWYLRRVFPVQRRLARGVRPLALLLGRADAVPGDALFDALARLVDDLSAVRALLSDPARTSVRLVLTPEAVVTAEARRTFTALALHGYAVDLVVANRVVPGDGDDPWRASWAAAQRRELAAVREAFTGVPVRELAYRAAEPVGTDELRAVAAELYGDDDPGAVRPVPPLLQVETDGPGGSDVVVSLALPLVEQGEVELARVGAELVVTVGGHRRVVDLPAALGRARVAGGELRDGRLRVRFALPDAVPPDDPGAGSRPVVAAAAGGTGAP